MNPDTSTPLVVTNPQKLRSSEFDIGVYKKGDDLAHCFRDGKEHTSEAAGQPAIDALRSLAQQYFQAYSDCMELAARLEQGDVSQIEIDADCHHIGVTGPESVIYPLVNDGILWRDPYLAEEEDGVLETADSDTGRRFY